MRNLGWLAAATIWFGIVVGAAWYVAPVPALAVMPPVMRGVDHPRCFPPGTTHTEGFHGCPDSLPDQRSA